MKKIGMNHQNTTTHTSDSRRHFVCYVIELGNGADVFNCITDEFVRR